MIAPRVPSRGWVALNCIVVVFWALAFLLAIFGKGEPRLKIIVWSIVFPIFAALLFGDAYTY